MVGDAAYGMTEPSNGEAVRAEVRVKGPAARYSQSVRKHDLLESMNADYSALEDWDRLGERSEKDDEIPAFAPAAEFAGNPRGLAGARLVSLTDGRQTHFAAEVLLRRAKKDDDVTLFAYSFDHPTVTSGIVEAVHRGAKVSIYMDHG